MKGWSVVRAEPPSAMKLRWISEPSALAAGLGVLVDHDNQSYLSAESADRQDHWHDSEQFEPPDFETRS